MLVVITVSAAVAFAAFVSEQQGKYQESQKLQQQTELEHVVVTKIGFNSSTNMIDNLSIQNTGVYNVDIWAIQINDFNVVSCDVNGSSTLFDGTNVIEMESLNIIHVDNFTSNVDKSGPITVTIWTKLQSHAQTFYPPVALIQLDMSVTPQICDGTKSYCVTDNTYIMQWHWTITSTDDPSSAYPLSKDSPKITSMFTSTYTYTITLDVTDNFGMTSTDTYTFTQP